MPARPQLGVQSGFAALASILLIAACGGSSKPTHSDAGRYSAFVAVSKCMRAHGVTDFPDPSSNGGIQLPNNFDVESPVFKSARDTCFKLLPGRAGMPKASATEIADARNTAQCMREHGVTSFPDPIVTTKPPYELNLNPADYSEVTAGGGLVIALPISINTQSPAFVKAAKICRFQQ
jgi:hypothetical protein